MLPSKEQQLIDLILKQKDYLDEYTLAKDLKSLVAEKLESIPTITDYLLYQNEPAILSLFLTNTDKIKEILRKAPANAPSDWSFQDLNFYKIQVEDTKVEDMINMNKKLDENTIGFLKKHENFSEHDLINPDFTNFNSFKLKFYHAREDPRNEALIKSLVELFFDKILPSIPFDVIRKQKYEFWVGNRKTSSTPDLTVRNREKNLTSLIVIVGRQSNNGREFD